GLDDHVETARAELARLDRRLAADGMEEAGVRAQLAAMARFDYEQSQSPLAVLLDSQSISQLLGQIAQDRIVTQKQADLVAEAVRLRAADRAARAEAASQLSRLRAAQAGALKVAAEAGSMLAAAQTAALRQEASSLAREGTAIEAGGGGGNHFDFGYCTWYVANRRYIPWFGNAGQWWANARAYGYAEGQAPRPGAVMVTGESPYGHVAYVESVHADGSWTVSEMDFTGWDQVDRRTLRPGQAPVVGFIYGRAG
ncbi:MAG: CHAP domain-containing protein, partial [Candidatus Dormibacterales bacterium]